ncbi:MAG TPA: polysaccharide deacetylase family protein [Longimicrobiales bacterium]|nr:polysaccharide deacetylase family protein [Longimicrobiales bacterium]
MRWYSTGRSAPLRTATLLAACVASCDAAPPGEMPGRPDAASPASRRDSAQAMPAMAVTIDDLPWVGAIAPGSSRADALRSLADTLTSRGVPAIGFANCDRAGAGARELRTWVDAGLQLGNHTAAHMDLNDAPLEQWLSGVRTCHDMVRDINGGDTVWFRYPYLHQGPTAERKDAALATLEQLESPIAHVTIDNSDWILAVSYGEAVVRGDSSRAAAIGEAFVDHIIRATQHYQQVARQKAGRDVPHVLLLHASQLVTDNIGTLLDRLREEHGFRFVGTAEAQSDSVYDRSDEYIGENGLSFLYRMEPASPEMVEWDDAEASRLRAEWR